MLNLSYSMKTSMNVHERLDALLEAYADLIANPSLDVQLAQELLRRCRGTPLVRQAEQAVPSGRYLSLHFSEQWLCILMQKLTWVYWPGIGLMTIRTGPVNIEGEAISGFTELAALRAVNRFTQSMLLNEVLQLSVHFFFLSVGGSDRGAAALDAMFAHYIRIGRGIPIAPMVRCWARWVLLTHLMTVMVILIESLI